MGSITKLRQQKSLSHKRKTKVVDYGMLSARYSTSLTVGDNDEACSR